MEKGNGKKTPIGLFMRILIMLMLVMSVGGIVSSCERQKDNSVTNEREPAGLPEWKEGDKTYEVTHNNAKAYAEFYEYKTSSGLSDLETRTVIENQGKKKILAEQSTPIEFSPDGRYLLYWYRESKKYSPGLFIYDTQKDESKQLTSTKTSSNIDPEKPDPNYVPIEVEGEITWGDGFLSFKADDKTWKLSF